MKQQISPIVILSRNKNETSQLVIKMEMEELGDFSGGDQKYSKSRKKPQLTGFGKFYRSVLFFLTKTLNYEVLSSITQHQLKGFTIYDHKAIILELVRKFQTLLPVSRLAMKISISICIISAARFFSLGTTAYCTAV